ncbi:DJ-1/PfpI family protein [Mumia sp. zg.B21]|uniref:GlxA family transcriptional regulator n=1 Tax=unclassified Mumia TaxID=2621872 RepID=UPI001C6EB603|nr:MULTISPECIES: helix-turn-helix domain-containing protein [unclassified Mumia]MBW9210538.1 DJ-1/PfpI family protein [Mumia sp. zg.B21]MDD9349522.1 DJ-1/PfpI family protein [Mumia sp.]
MAERTVVVVAYEQAELLDISCITTPLMMANMIGTPRIPYAWRLASPGGLPVVATSGLTLAADEALERVETPLDTVIVSGGMGHERAAESVLVRDHVRRLSEGARRTASVCTGATVLAAAGLLDDRRATTHWQFAARLARHHPSVVVDAEPIFIRDGSIATAAGVTSALDLTLAFIEEDHGAELARQVARYLVTYLQRPGSQAQMSIHTSAPAPDSPVLRRVTAYVTTDPAAPADSTALADVAGVSVRHLARVFASELGTTPARYVRTVRLEAASHLLEETSEPLSVVARRCGFGSAEMLRQSFVRHYGTTPSAYRRAHARAHA